MGRISAAELAEFGEVRTQLHAAIDAKLEAAIEVGLRPGDLGDVSALKARVSASIPVGRHPTAELVGPCFDTPGLATWLGISKQAIDQRNKAGTILACRTESGAWRYPAMQFDEHGNTIPGLATILGHLAGPDRSRRWRAARWLAAPAPYLPNPDMSAAQWLLFGGEPEPVIRAAKTDAARWAA